MTKQPRYDEFVGRGLYTVPEAAQLLRSPKSTLRRWVEGYEAGRRGERRSMPPLWEPSIGKVDDQLTLSFRDLIDLRFVKAFLDRGLSLQAVRACLEVARDCLQDDQPFSTGRFRTDGQTIFLEGSSSDDPALLDLRRKQFAFRPIIEQTFKDLDFEDDPVARWRPYKGKTSIVIDPKRSFGQPVAAVSGVPTVALAEAVGAEGSAERVAALYDVDLAVVKDAVAFHNDLAAA